MDRNRKRCVDDMYPLEFQEFAKAVGVSGEDLYNKGMFYKENTGRFFYTF